MRIALAVGAIALATSSFAATPVLAQQGGTYMWCTAWTEGATDKAYFYSAFFAAGAWEAERKALKFKSEVERKEVSGSTVKATCMAPADYDMAVATRNAVMKGAPGKVLSWEG